MNKKQKVKRGQWGGTTRKNPGASPDRFNGKKHEDN